ncbi:uncharacterized protein B0H18DRAFT_1023774 [Fomitopsis serialis]|uniref:uncharacterized protein n=1 Tax=Fomitopsis serialis TaxID=139415 RepID=UPI0020082B9F|nr:uncharacterized protein B0H18DRAFT_1023774 [Neoantrodia serialis]KAH9920640.1 hypothetical protein B0H18DRAFT_1023774 [Neoantrodia serialis]
MSDSKVAIFTYNLVEDYGAAAVTTFIIYDYLLTLGDEVELVWSLKPSASSVVYMLSRYPLLFYVIFPWIIYTNPGLTPSLSMCLFTERPCSCTGLSITSDVMATTFVLMVAAFGALRIYAVSGRDWRLVLPALALGLVPAVTNLYDYAKSAYEIVELTGGSSACSQVQSLSRHLSKTSATVVIISRTCAVASDMIVIFAICWYSRRHIKLANHLKNKRPSLMMLMTRDGEHFRMRCLLVIFNALDMALALTKEYGQSATIFVNPTTSVFLSRSLLNLRAATHVLEESYDLDTLTFTYPLSSLLISTQSQASEHAMTEDALASNVTSEGTVCFSSIDTPRPPDTHANANPNDDGNVHF